MNISEEKRWQILDLIGSGLTYNEIIERTGVCRQTIAKIKKNKLSNADLGKYRWLKRNWNFTGKTCGNDAYIGNYKNGYRVVRKGEKGHLRTPYRTDYIFK